MQDAVETSAGENKIEREVGMVSRLTTSEEKGEGAEGTEGEET